MKLKNFFNSQRKDEVVQEIKNDFKPIFEKVTIPVTTYAKRNPKKTFLLMVFIVVANILILFFFTNAFKTKEAINGSRFPEFTSVRNNGTIPDIEISFENIRKVKAMKDTLNYLISLPQMSYHDTLTFIKLMDEFHKISSGNTGLPSVSLEDLRKARKNTTIDTTIDK